MNMINFSQEVSAGVKRIALAGLVCLTALVFVAVAMNGAKQEANTGDQVFAATTTTKTCTADANNPEGAPGKSCLGANQYCISGTCKEGCIGYQGGSWFFVDPGAPTCYKPGAGMTTAEAAADAEGQADAVYKCSAAKRNDGGTYYNLTVETNGTVSSSSIYVLNTSTLCNYGDCIVGSNTCGVSKTKCKNTADYIQSTFNTYYNYKKNGTVKDAINEAIDAARNDKDDSTTSDTAKAKVIKKYKNALLAKLMGCSLGGNDEITCGSNTTMTKSEAEGMLKKFEKMLYGSKDGTSTEKGIFYGLSNDGKLPLLTQQIGSTDKISCQRLEGEYAINSWCPFDKADQFWGYSYECVQSINGCYMYSWVDSGPEICKDEMVPAYDLWSGAGFPIGSVVDDGNDHAVGFVQDDNGKNGIITGGALNGCGYISDVMADKYPMTTATTPTVDFTKDPLHYREVNKIFTGKCLSPDSVKVSVVPTDPNVDKLGCAARDSEGTANDSPEEASEGDAEPEFENGEYDYDDDCTPWVCIEGDWAQDVDCAKATDDDAKAECKAGKEKCDQGVIDEGCAKDSNCPDGQYCVFDNLDDYNNADASAKDGKTGTCGAVGCQSSFNGGATFADGAVVCGSDGNSQKCNLEGNKSWSSWKYWEVEGEECDEEGCDKETGECKSGEDESDEECTDISISDGTAKETTSNCGGKECSGVCVPFSVKETGDCSDLTCTVGNDYDGGKATGYRGSSGQWFACMNPKSSSSSSSSGTSKGNGPDTINYSIKCTDAKSGQTDTAEGNCGFPQGDDNPYSEKEEETQDGENGDEGEGCAKDSDCQEGLICEDGVCAESCIRDSDCGSDQTCEDGACADKGSAEEGDDCGSDTDCEDGLVCEDGTCTEETAAEAPTVTVTSPTGTVTAKTAQLTVTTNLNATCKYMDVTSGGSFTAANFSGNGMTMSSSGYTHIVTLSSLADSTTGTSSDCKKMHNIVVLCQNSEAKDQSSTTSIGSGQASFTVDLSANAEYAPTVTSAMSSTSFTVANPVLKVATDRPASCQFSKDNTFTYGSGTDFTTTGSYSHNTELSDLTTDDYVYYVVCKDADTCAANTGLKISFSVALAGGTSTMTVTSATAATQAVANPTISVNTDLPAACQYKVGGTFTYGAGTQFTNDNDYSHTSSLIDLEDGNYELYVVCQEKETLAIKVLSAPITTILDRAVEEDEPEASNTTEINQSTGSPTISITTTLPAKCQYSTVAGFAYGDGTQFTTDGSTGHSVELSGVEDGEHTYYILCKDVSTGKVNSNPIEIVFEVSNNANTCADLDSNDRQSDDDRDYDEADNSDSKYVWRSVEDGTRDEFTKVDWYAGYQFTTDDDGYVTQLCGYFADGESNEVTLYNGSYKALATATVEGTDDWECATISPVAVKSDKRYYVIARVEDGPINYEYQSGLLPVDANNVVIESGIRQLAEEDFGEDVFKYDYMVFGLVDVKVIFSGDSEEGPEIDINGPIGSVDDDSATLSIETNVNAKCRFSRDDVEYSDMEYDFGKTGEKEHEQLICNLDEGNFTYYIRCEDDDGEANDASTLLQFEVSD